ncbi:hypothetical protein BGZ94_003814, partial [Podila epigama]
PPEPDCKCKGDRKKYCGSEFPRECGFSRESVYECSGDGATPQRVERCTPLKCLLEPEPHCEVIPVVCKCKDGRTSMCGSEFPAACAFDNETVYDCGGDGTATEKQDCPPDKCIATPEGGAKCDVKPPEPDCKCKGDKKKVCGSEFPAACNLARETVYECSTDGTPVEVQNCNPLRCIVGPEAQCEVPPPDCDCKEGRTQMCGSEFPAECRFPPNTVYTCDAKGVSTASQNCNPYNCIATPDGGAKCDVPPPEPDCTCTQGKAKMCGSEFPVECKLNPESVYTCDADRKATESEKCDPYKCLTTPEAKCDGPPPGPDCKCKAGKDTVCGKSFPAECGFAADDLFSCSGPSSEPTKVESCLANECITVNNVDQCVDHGCDCKDGSSSHCSTNFPARCALDSIYVYTCSETGGAPVRATDPCLLGCEVVVPQKEARCKIDICNCKEGETTKCGSAWDASCKFSDSTVYNCDGLAGKRPVVLEECTPLTCEQKGDTAACKMDPCMCQSATGQIDCGSAFDPSCGLNANYLYACKEAGAKPVEVAKCEPLGCDQATKTCKVDPCACQGTGNYCGKSWTDPSCKYDPEAVYTCKEIGATPVKQEDCTAGCILGSGVCAVDPCICTKDEVVCGSAFPTTCSLNPDILYECKIGSKPVEKEQCIKDGCIAGTHKCAVDPCKCVDVQGTCGKDYPTTCGYESNSIYDCTGQGATPAKTQACASDEICTVSDKVATCVPDCTCKEVGDKCGVDLPTKCNFDKDTVYTCSKVGDPYTAKEKCPAGKCKTGTSACEINPCVCDKVGSICGKDFPAACTTLGKDNVYVCAEVGGDPIEAKVCPAGKCINGDCPAEADCVCDDDGPFCGTELLDRCPGLNPDLYYSCQMGKKPFPFDRCSGGEPLTGKCLCNDANSICSSYFPFECGYRQDMIQGCPGDRGTKPVKLEQCAVGRCTAKRECDRNCLCTGANSLCGKHYDASCGYDPSTIYTCSGDGATPVASTKCATIDRCVSNVGIAKCLGACQCEDYYD